MKRTIWRATSKDAFLAGYEDGRSPCNRGQERSPREAALRLAELEFTSLPDEWSALVDAYGNGWDDAQRGDSFRHDLIRFNKATNANGQVVYAYGCLDPLTAWERAGAIEDREVNP